MKTLFLNFTKKGCLNWLQIGTRIHLPWKYIFEKKSSIELMNLFTFCYLKNIFIIYLFILLARISKVRTNIVIILKKEQNTIRTGRQPTLKIKACIKNIMATLIIIKIQRKIAAFLSEIKNLNWAFWFFLN